MPLKIILIIIALLSLAPSAEPQDRTVTVAPMQMRAWMPVVEVKLNGQGPFAFMIDTGAGMQADIDTSVAEKLGLQASGVAINGDPSGENDRPVEVATIDSIAFGSVEFRKVTAVVRPQRI